MRWGAVVEGCAGEQRLRALAALLAGSLLLACGHTARDADRGATGNEAGDTAGGARPGGGSGVAGSAPVSTGAAGSGGVASGGTAGSATGGSPSEGGTGATVDTGGQGTGASGDTGGEATGATGGALLGGAGGAEAPAGGAGGDGNPATTGGTGGAVPPVTGGSCPSWKAGCPCTQPPPIYDTLCVPRLDLPATTGTAGAAGSSAVATAGDAAHAGAGGAASLAGAAGAAGSSCPEYDSAWWDDGYSLADGSPATFSLPCGWRLVDLVERRVTDKTCCFDVMLTCDACM